MSDVLWHYTRQRGLLGILADGNMWATDFRFLNDGEEYRHALGLIADAAQRSAYDEMFVKQLCVSLSFLRQGEDVAREPIFVVAFSAARDDLSQWRAYAPFGTGFAIGFDREQLEVKAREHGAELVQCCYPPDACSQVFVGEALEAIAVNSEYAYTNAKDHEDVYDACAGIVHWIRSHLKVVRACIAVKHNAFKHEYEWRVWSAQRDRRICFRDTRTTMIPFISLPLSGEEVIKEIVIGPSSNPSLSKGAVQMLCMQYGINPAISSSAIPYREL